jgi:signal peptidase I
MINGAAAQRWLRHFDEYTAMKTRPRWINSISSALLLVGMATAWMIFAPMQFGGLVAYVIVNGNSMQPLYQQGDLVIVHKAVDYQVGDIVTYRNPDIGPVIHRIVGQQDDQFILKGDHNTWTDSFLPAPADIIGKAWIQLRGVGKVFGYIRNPWILSIAVACIGALFLFTVIPAQTKKRPRRRRQAGKGTIFTMKSVFEKWDDWLFVLAVLAIAAVALAVAGFTHPINRTLLKDIHYEQQGVFSYSAVEGANPGVYDTSGLQTGEPVFHQLINKVNFQFDYQITSDNPINAQGTVRLIARLSSEDGWQKTLELQPVMPFTGAKISVSGSMNLDAIQAIFDNLEAQTGIQRQSYTVYIVSQVTLKGSIGGQTINENFVPQIQFQIDPLEMQMVQLDPTAPNPLYPSTNGLLKQPYTEPNGLSFLGVQIHVMAIRWVSIILLVLALGGLAALATFAYRTVREEGEPARIQRKYGTLLVSVNKGLPGRDEQVKDVVTMGDLAKLADKDGRLILHAVKGRNHVYFVQDAEIVYRYTATEADPEDIS